MTNRRHLSRMRNFVPYEAFYLLLQAAFLRGGGGGSHVVDGGEFRVRFVSMNVEWIRLAIIYVRLIKVKLISFSGKI